MFIFVLLNITLQVLIGSLIGHLPREMSRFVKIYLEDTSILDAVVLKIPILPTVKNG